MHFNLYYPFHSYLAIIDGSDASERHEKATQQLIQVPRLLCEMITVQQSDDGGCAHMFSFTTFIITPELSGPLYIIYIISLNV